MATFIKFILFKNLKNMVQMLQKNSEKFFSVEKRKNSPAGNQNSDLPRVFGRILTNVLHWTHILNLKSPRETCLPFLYLRKADTMLSGA